MEKTPFRLFVVADELLENRRQTFIDAFEILKKDYEVVEGLTLSYHFEFRSFKDVEWEDYWGDGESFGIKRSWIEEQNKKIKKLYGEEYASVVYLVDLPNWKVRNIGGWNLGRFYSGMSVQLIKGYINTRSAHMVLSMEVAHCLNEQVYMLIGKKLKDILGLKDWDFQVVHGEHKDYQKYYYENAFKKIASVLLRTFQVREVRFVNQLQTIRINLLQKVVGLMRHFIMLRRKVESPVYDNEVE